MVILRVASLQRFYGSIWLYFSVFDVCNVIGLERTVAGLHRMGMFDVDCCPLLSYESFSQMLQVDESLTLPYTHSLTDSQLYWLDFTVEFPGRSNTD